MAANKQILFAAFGVGLLLLVNHAGQIADTIDGLTVKCGVGGKPTVSGLSITFPVKVSVTNPGSARLPLDGLAMTLERLNRDGTTFPIAATNPAGVITPSIQAQAVTSFIVPVTTDFITALTEIITDLKAGGLGRYLLRTTIVTAGIRVPLPPQTLTF